MGLILAGTVQPIEITRQPANIGTDASSNRNPEVVSNCKSNFEHKLICEIIFMLIPLIPAYPQYNEPPKIFESEAAWVLKTAYVYQNGNYGELGVFRRKVKRSVSRAHDFTGIIGPSISSEFKLDQLIFGPKVGFEIHYGFLGVRASAIYFTDFGKSSLKLNTEVGISYKGIFFLSQGYYLNLSKNEIDVGKFKIALTVNTLLLLRHSEH